MKASIQLIVLLFFLLLIQACTGETPTGSRKPPLPVAVPDARAFDNLALIRSLEKSRRSETWLTEMNAIGLQRNGRISPGSAWQFLFVKTNPATLYAWSVFSDGRITEPAGLPPAKPSVGLIDLEQHLKIDSDRALAIAKKNGADVYLTKYPNAWIRMHYYLFGRIPVCDIELEEPGKHCPIAITLHSETGEVLGTDLNCNVKKL